MIEKYFILDTDIGSDIDDAMALLLCLRIQDFHLVAITTVYNCVELRARIAKKMLILDNRDIPVGIGIKDPIDELSFLWATGHEGEGLLSNEDLKKSLNECSIIEDGIALMIATAKKYANNVELITIGPMTNIATAIQRDSKFTTYVSKIWSMSAGVTFNLPIPDNFPIRNKEYFAIPSHNIRCDIEAAEIVLNSNIPITFIGNDVTTKVFFKEKYIPKVKNQGSALNKAVIEMMRVWLNYRSKIFNQKVTQTCLHDALVVAEAIGMEFTKKIPININLSDLGSTKIYYNPESHHQISWSVDSESFINWFLETISN